MMRIARRIKISYIIGQLEVGGTQLQVMELLQHLDFKRFEPQVIFLSDGNARLHEKFSLLNIPIYILGRNRVGRLKTIWSLYLLLQKIKPDIVHAFSYASRAAIPVSRFLMMPRIVVSFRTDPARWVTSFDRLLVNVSDLILENSHMAVHSYNVLNGKSKAPEIRVIHNGIDIHKFDQMSKAGIALPDFCDQEQNGPVICIVSSLRPVKQLPLLINAFTLLKARIPFVSLWVVGDGDERARLEKQVANIGIKGSVTFWGERKDIPAILKRVSLGVLSSEYEGVSNALLEYMAASLPVVVTDVGGNHEVVVNGKTGILVPFGDPKSFADAMFSLIQNSELSREYGKAGRYRVEKKFNIQRMIREMEDTYFSLVRGEKIG
ncbi:MAG: glycosyltransferase [Anaerolineales bacterium]|nr:glycosyltransferase [Anaerolineales bacterium]